MTPSASAGAPIVTGADTVGQTLVPTCGQLSVDVDNRFGSPELSVVASSVLLMAPFVAPGTGGGRSPDGAAPADVVCAELTAVLAWLAGHLTDPRAHDDGHGYGPTGVDDATRIDRIALFEKVTAAAGAAQSREIVGFARSQVDTQLHADVDPRLVGRGIGEQIALACRISPTQGARRLTAARALWFELPAVAAAYRDGDISEYVAGLVVSETRHLDPALRARVDEQLVAAGITGLSPRRAAATARRLAYEADPAGYVTRGRTERKNRRVSLRPAPDTMTNLTGFLPVEQGVACYAALTRHTDAVIGAGDGRTRDQIMADTMVERLTGQAAATDVGVEVQIVLPVEALLDPDSPRTAAVTGHGPLPARLAHDIIAATTGRRWWRRLFTAPTTGPATVGQPGPIVGGDPRRRRFDGWLAALIGARDGGRCRDPFCDAPIRHTDHIIRHRDGGPTSLTNGRGVCARGNYVREMPGWTVETIDDGLHGKPHAVRTSTPTGHVYTSHAPRPP